MYKNIKEIKEIFKRFIFTAERILYWIVTFTTKCIFYVHLHKNIHICNESQSGLSYLDRVRGQFLLWENIKKVMFKCQVKVKKLRSQG